MYGSTNIKHVVVSRSKRRMTTVEAFGAYLTHDDLLLCFILSSSDFGDCFRAETSVV
jgi:hypothetical protein